MVDKSMDVNIGKNGLKNILILVLTLLLLFVTMAGMASADNQAGNATASGTNVTLNSTSATGIMASSNTTLGANITVYFNTTNSTAINTTAIWNINASNSNVSINGSGSPNGTIALNGTFTLNSTNPTDFFSVTVTNADNSSENTTLTGFRFVNSTAIVSSANTTISYNNGTIPTSVLTGVYYFYNDTYINITISTIAKMDNVTVNYTNVSEGIGYNVTGANVSGRWYYNITNVSTPSAPNRSVNLLYANLSFNGVNYTVNVPFVALMNFNPINMVVLNLSGETTNWRNISDFTNITNLTFERVVSGNSTGLLTFTEAINLTNQTTALALANLSTYLQMRGTYMNLNSTASALAAMNVSANLTFYNISQYFSGERPSILVDGVSAVNSNGTQLGDDTIGNVIWNNPNISFTTQHWSNISLESFGANLTNQSVLSNSTIASSGNAGTNVTYVLNLTNNGTKADSYNLSISNPNSATVTGLNISNTSFPLASGASKIFALNVSSNSGGTFPVNVTATSTNDTSKISFVNTITTVYEYGANLTNVSVLSNSTTAISGNAGTNVTYVLNLTNNGTLADSYNITYTNPNNATVVGFNITNVSSYFLPIGASKIFSLNVSSNSSGTFPVNVTATSNNDTSKISFVNTTTTVNEYGANLTNISGLTDTTATGTNATYTFNLTNNGTLADSYNLSISNPNNATVTGLNISTTNFSLDKGASKTITLNVSNSSTGTFPVNVTVTSNNDTSKISFLNTTTTVNEYGVNLTLVLGSSNTTNAGTNATYTLNLTNSGAADSYNITYTNPDGASVIGFNINNVSYYLDANTSKTFTLNVTNASSGTFHVNVTATSTNDSTKVSYVNTTTIVPIVITITNPSNVNDTGYVNVTVILDAEGLAQNLNWQGVNYSMTPNASKSSGTIFYKNMTGLLSGNYTFKIYANDTSSGITNVSETRTITVNRTTSTSLTSYINLSTFIVNLTINVPSPSGNSTITIPNGTNASINGSAITNVTINSLAQLNSTFVANLGTSDKIIGENLSIGPAGAIFSPDIQIRINYTDAMLTAAGISASELRIKFYNTSTNSWVVQTPYTLNSTGEYITANVSHFSTFALIGTTTTTTTTTTSGNGGTGGGGVTTSEPFANIAKAERHDNTLLAGKPVTYTFKTPELGVYEILVTGKENEYGIALRVEALKGTSKLVSASPPGTVYKNVNVWAGTKRIKEALIRFNVENSWLDSNNIASVKMVRWHDNKWTALSTTRMTKGAKYTSYEAKTGGFSSFAIVGFKEGEAVSTETPTPETVTTTPAGEKTPAPEATTEKPAPGFEVLAAMLAVTGALYFRNKD